MPLAYLTPSAKLGALREGMLNLKKLFLIFILLGGLSNSRASQLKDEIKRQLSKPRGDFLVNSKSPHQMRLLSSGLSALQLRLNLINSAQTSIELEYFIYNSDNAGKLITQALLKKVKEGVSVRLLLDHFMISSQITPFHAHELEKAGVKVRFYNDLLWIHAFKAQYRNHRKTFIIDGKKAIIGGRNIGNEYFDLDNSFNFIDREIFIEGPIVKNIQETFNAGWSAKPTVSVKRQNKPKRFDLRYRRHAGGSNRLRASYAFEEDLRRWKRRVRQAKNFLKIDSDYLILKERISSLAPQLLSEQIEGTCHDVTFASDRPGVGAWTQKKARILKYVVYDRMFKSRNHLLIDSPYFIVEGAYKEILKELLEQGRKIEVLTNSLYSTDAFYVNAHFNTILPTWLKKGLRATVFSGDVLPDYKTLSPVISKARWGTHSKTFVFDEESFMVGSYNFDSRSSYYSTELAVFCDDGAELANAIKDSIRRRMENGILLKTKKDIDKYKFKKTSLLKRLGYYLVKIPAALFDHLL